jgi:hypothetical protein
MCKKNLSALIIIIVSLFPFIINGCGDDRDSGDDGNSALSYTGLTTQAVIDATNAQEIIGKSINAVRQNMAVPILSVNQPLKNQPDPGFLTLWIPLIIEDSLTMGVRSFETNPLSRTHINTVADIKYGNCGGHATCDLDTNNLTGETAGSVTYSDYCDMGITISGTSSLSGTKDLVTDNWITAIIAFDNLIVESNTFNGNISLDNTVTPGIVTMNVYSKDNTSGKVFWIDGYKLGIIDRGDEKEGDLNGTFYHPDYGYVILSMDDTFIVYDGDEWPSTGSIFFEGDNSTEAQLAILDKLTCRIEADTDGDGIYDWDSGILSWSDL